MQHLTVIVSGYFLHKIIYALLMRPELCVTMAYEVLFKLDQPESEFTDS